MAGGRCCSTQPSTQPRPKPVASCTCCCRLISVTLNGVFRQHGPISARCPGSGMCSRMTGLSSAPVAAAAPLSVTAGSVAASQVQLPATLEQQITTVEVYDEIVHWDKRFSPSLMVQRESLLFQSWPTFCRHMWNRRVLLTRLSLGSLFCQRYCCSVPMTSLRPSNRRSTCTIAWLSGVKATSVNCSLKGGTCRITLVVMVAGTLDHPSRMMKHVHSGTW